MAYASLGQYARAIQNYDKTISLDPKFAVVYAYRSVAYTSVGKDAEARQDIERAVELGVERATVEQAVEQAKQQR